MKLKTFNINFNAINFNNNILSYPFEIVYTTNNGKIEKQCVEKFPNVTDGGRNFTISDNRDLVLMKNFIKKQLSQTNEANNVNKIFYDRRWFSPAQPNWNISKVEFNDYHCQIWEANIPYLKLKGIIYIDIKKLLKKYIDSKMIRLDFTTNFLLKECKIHFTKDLPLILRYLYIPSLYIYLKDQIITFIKTPGNSMNVKFKKWWDVRNIKQFSVVGQWDNDNTLHVEIKDITKLLYHNVKKHPLKTALGATIAAKALKKTRVPLITRRRKIT